MNEEFRHRLERLTEALIQFVEGSAVQERLPALEPEPLPRDCMTRRQLAHYLQVTEQAIKNWQDRSNNPLPCGYVGDTPRYFLADVKQWSIEEAQRRRGMKSTRAKKLTTHSQTARKLSATLTAATKPKGGSNASLQTVQGPAN